ncbi:hypothetical protein [Methanocalculus sp.]|uniref:hypothetical protein n=1 Tax=Methanocalculus sp. TaxID=2004547 RepID=UPI002616B4C7|nr:hypothetical protein [Methanocalculus sp.]MDG6249959.1 hypothetical protein [Methanocalculus sp.]
MPDTDESQKRSGTLADCILNAVQWHFSGTISCMEVDGVRAQVIFISGEPAGAEYADGAGTIYGDIAVLRLPTKPIYTISPLPVAEAEGLASCARIYHPERLFAHATVKKRREARSPAETSGVGRLTIRVASGQRRPVPLRIELWSEGRICGTDTLDQNGKASFRLLEGEYECRLREGIRLIGKKTFRYPGGDMEITIPVDGAA